MAQRAIFLGMLGALALAGCEEREVVLPGDRLGVREVLQSQLVGETVSDTQSRAISIPAAQNNSDWAQSFVSPSNRVSNAALSATPALLWSTNIGEGDGRRVRLNVDPVAGGGRVYTVDSAHVVRAVSNTGDILWSYDQTPLRDSAEQAQGGGLAFAGDRLYVASGFGALTTLDAATGREIWSQKLGNSVTGAPTIRDGVVYLVSGDQVAWALEAEDGRIRWQIDGVGDSHNVAGAPAPAVGDKHVIFSFGNASVQAAFRQGGLRLWNADILGRRGGIAIGNVDDITGDPVISGNTVYAGNYAGRVVALSLFDGERLWTARHGAKGAIWPTGDSIFFVSDLNKLVRLDAATGEQIWTVDLPFYETSRKPQKRRGRAYTMQGPILAGGRLIVAGSDGLLRSFDPADGSLTSSIEMPDGATARPIVAGGTLYIVSAAGDLLAYR